MKYCPITYEAISPEENYSRKGLKLLSSQLQKLDILNFSAAEQRKEAIQRTGKMSIQGVQTKLSARLKIKEHDGRFDIVDQAGLFILKPQSEFYPELPENEAITMTLADKIGIEVPLHGLIYTKDSMTYFIKRFDREGKQKIAVEDFSQLSESTRYTKYDSSMEKVAKIIFTYCTFPKVEAMKLFRLIIFNFLVGNEDMHLKNFSLIIQDKAADKRIVTLSPSYDLLNTTIALEKPQEELALPLNGKKKNLRKKDFVQFALQHLQLNEATIGKVLRECQNARPEWDKLIAKSFLSATMRKKYLAVLNDRFARI